MNKSNIRAIETSFPYSWIKSLSLVERKNKRYLQASLKWFDSYPALYRLLLLEAILPSIKNPAEEYKKNQAANASGAPLTVLDPYMGFGAILAEARRLNMRTIGVELNPVSWFFAKTLLEPVAKDRLVEAFKRLADTLNFESMPLKQAINGFYATECPCCSDKTTRADAVHTFWIQSAICTNGACQRRIPLFEDFIIYQKTISIKYLPDHQCPHCKKAFDWELEPASFISESKLMFNSPGDAAGAGRGNRRWIYSMSTVNCPWCHETIAANPASGTSAQKKISLSILLCPYCQAVWQYRGNLPQNVRCPDCGSSYYPRKGNVQQKKWYTCPFCGTMDKISNSYSQLTEKQRLPTFPYAIEGQCPNCQSLKSLEKYDAGHAAQCMLWKNKGRFFKRIGSNDLSRYLNCSQTWNAYRTELPVPDTEILINKETRTLIDMNFLYWRQLFNERQLLSFACILKAIREETDEKCRNQLLLAFLLALESNNLYTVYDRKRTKADGIFARSDSSLPFGYVEQNVWGVPNEEATFSGCVARVCENADFMEQPHDLIPQPGNLEIHFSGESYFSDLKSQIWCSSLNSLISQSFLDKVDLIITEPPAEVPEPFSYWADFYYAWLKAALEKQHAFLSSRHCRQTRHENPAARKRTLSHLRRSDLKAMLTKCGHLVKPEGFIILIHRYESENAWLNFAADILDSGMTIEAIVPFHVPGDESEAESSRLVHFCRIREKSKQGGSPDWQKLSTNMRAELSNRFEQLQKDSQRFEALSGTEIQGLFSGWSISYLSKIYPQQQTRFWLEALFLHARIFADHVFFSGRQLPEDLLDIDAESYTYMIYLSGSFKIKLSELQSRTRHLVKIESLKRAGLIAVEKMQVDANIAITHPLDRFDTLTRRFSKVAAEISEQQGCFEFIDTSRQRERVLFIDKLHFLIGLSFYDENTDTWLEAWRDDKSRFKSACSFLKSQNEELGALTEKLVIRL
ncbi:hypothetical protein JXJ21_13440 [candidate division KSB1 bacterium]|nr:hypothetical protein [candidate division KSB1 bacterium]